jgi:hypothetical protein
MLVCLGISAAAQTKPDFSGVWAPVPKKAASGATGGVAALPPSDLTIKQTATELSISRTAFDIVNTQTHRLDGAENTNKSGAVVRVSRARWDGPRLVIEGKASQVTSAGYSAWTFRETYALKAPGHLVMTGDHVDSDGKVTTGGMEYTKKPVK